MGEIWNRQIHLSKRGRRGYQTSSLWVYGEILSSREIRIFHVILFFQSLNNFLNTTYHNRCVGGETIWPINV